MSAPSRIGIVGTGRAARALAAALGRSLPEGALCVWGRNETGAREIAQRVGAVHADAPEDLLARAEVLLLAVRDDAVTEVAARLARALEPGRGAACEVALHLAGAVPATALAPLAARGMSCGVFHPVVALVDETSAARLAGATATVSGDPRARAAAVALARRLGMVALEVRDEARAAVHLACVMAAGDVVTLLGLAEELLAGAGVAADDARRLLAALARSAADAFESCGAAGGLTGPVPRGDAATLARHRDALPDEGEAGAVHRALTASRLLLADGGRVKVCGFGHARRMERSDRPIRSGRATHRVRI
ncbi:MAG: DUF2520 domain-containing protein, partial [Acidobacteria bacterium]